MKCLITKESCHQHVSHEIEVFEARKDTTVVIHPLADVLTDDPETSTAADELGASVS